MTPSQQHGQYFELVEESVITRTMGGIINFWNHSAEKLYGWRKEDAIGRVSHELLQTQFPKPLKEIESELVEKGRWEGKLLHATRDGGRVVVESRWTLDLTGQQESVVETNARSTDYQIYPEPDKDSHSVEMGRQKPLPARKLAKVAWAPLFGIGVLTIATVWIFYAFFGRLLIRAMYTSDFGIVDRVMAGRAFTPVENYYLYADRLLWSGTLRILVGLLIGWLTIRNFLGLLLAGFSLLVSSFLAFCAFEMAPSLIKPFHLDVISPYYAYKANYVYDEQLLFSERPFNQSLTVDFKGADYSPIYGIDVPPMTIEWGTDENGFRNSQTQDFADIVVIGDSYMEYGANESDTFPKRLQEKLPGVTITNLAKSGYGPFQYLEVLKRFGLKYKPRYALFAFYEGNDILDIQNYRHWKAGNSEAAGDLTYIAAQRSFFGRYWLALKTTADQLSEVTFVRVRRALDKNPLLGEERYKIHPDLALLDLGDGKRHKMHIADNNTRWHGAMLERENWAALERILRDFRDVCAAHQIIPIVVYIPSSSHIYAQFSTKASGGNWLAIREREIATKKDPENAVTRLVQSAGLDFISLSPVLERGAREGKLLYFPLDAHWNSEGTELTADYVADYLRTNYLFPSNLAQ